MLVGALVGILRGRSECMQKSQQQGADIAGGARLFGG